MDVSLIILIGVKGHTIETAGTLSECYAVVTWQNYIYTCMLTGGHHGFELPIKSQHLEKFFYLMQS